MKKLEISQEGRQKFCRIFFTVSPSQKRKTNFLVDFGPFSSRICTPKGGIIFAFIFFTKRGVWRPSDDMNYYITRLMLALEINICYIKEIGGRNYC